MNTQTKEEINSLVSKRKELKKELDEEPNEHREIEIKKDIKNINNKIIFLTN